jgi:hypothetical protein
MMKRPRIAGVASISAGARTASNTGARQALGPGRRLQSSGGKLEDKLAGRVPESKPEDDRRTLLDCIDLFLKDKRLQGIQGDALEKYTRDTARLRKYCEAHDVITVDDSIPGLSR